MADLAQIYTADVKEGVYFHPKEELIIEISDKEFIYTDYFGGHNMLCPRFRIQSDMGLFWSFIKPEFKNQVIYLGEL